MGEFERRIREIMQPTLIGGNRSIMIPNDVLEVVAEAKKAIWVPVVEWKDKYGFLVTRLRQTPDSPYINNYVLDKEAFVWWFGEPELKEAENVEG